MGSRDIVGEVSLHESNDSKGFHGSKDSCVSCLCYIGKWESVSGILDFKAGGLGSVEIFRKPFRGSQRYQGSMRIMDSIYKRKLGDGLWNLRILDVTSSRSATISIALRTRVHDLNIPEFRRITCVDFICYISKFLGMGFWIVQSLISRLPRFGKWEIIGGSSLGNLRIPKDSQVPIF